MSRGGKPPSSALVIAHPGHELLVHHWLEIERPVVAVLTDGSGGSGGSRLPFTTAILRATGAVESEVFGPHTDRAVYAAILAGDPQPFLDLLDRLVELLEGAGVDRVVGDACEGYNPVHDLCRAIIDSAVERVRRVGGRVIENLAFSVSGPAGDLGNMTAGTRIGLDAAAQRRKAAAAAAYAPLADEVVARIRCAGASAYAVEVLVPSRPTGPVSPPELPPYYERVGDERVRQSVYREVLRYERHFRPLADCLWRSATEAEG